MALRWSNRKKADRWPRRAIFGAALLGAAILGAAILGVGAVAAGLSVAPALPVCPDQQPILIDPGHGGIDGGTNLPGILEKEIVLDLALRTQKQLEKLQIPVLLTRSVDADLGGKYDGLRLRRDLQYRIRVANHCRALLMLSLHVNSSTDKGERGVMIFHQSSRPSRDAAFVVDNLLRTHQLHSRPERPYPRPDIAVLRWPKAPSLLVEMGFLSNDEDRELLADSGYREQFAQALAASISIIYQHWLKNG